MSSKVLLAATSVVCVTVYALLSTQLTCHNFTKVLQLTNPSRIDATIYDKVKTFLLFIGYNRSRHTLLASLLDAHPNVIIANDFNILRQWIENPLLSQRRKQYIYELLLAKSRYDVMFGVRSRPVGEEAVQYHYSIKDQWQGSYNKSIQVIGDKKAAQASRILLTPEGIESLNELEQKLGVQLKFIHVIRNPFDNIATMVRRRAEEKQKRHQNLKVNYSVELDRTISSYSQLVQGSFDVKKNFPGRVLDVPSIEAMTHTRETLTKICDFLEITCSEKYLQDCAAIIDPVPSKTRHNLKWTGNQLNRVQRLIEKFPFLRRYSFEH